MTKVADAAPTLRRWLGKTIAVEAVVLIAVLTTSLAALFFFDLAQNPNHLALLLIGVVGVFAFRLWSLYQKLDVEVAAPLERLVVGARTLAHGQGLGDVFVNKPGQVGEAFAAMGKVQAALEESAASKAAMVAEARDRADRIKARLELVIRDLNQGIIICNLDHEILLFNTFALSTTQSEGHMGLRRPLFDCMAAEPLRHGLMRLQNRFSSGRYLKHEDGLTLPLALASKSGKLTFDAVMTLTLTPEGKEPTGYMLTISDLPHVLAENAEVERKLSTLSETIREQAASVQLLSEALSDTELEEERRKSFRQYLLMEAQKLAESAFHLDTLAQDRLARSWPMARVMSDTLYIAISDRTRLEEHFYALDADEQLWFKCDSSAIGMLLARLMEWLHAEYAPEGRLYVVPWANSSLGFVDIRFQGQSVALKALNRWLDTALDNDLGPVTARDVLARHGTDLWSMKGEGEFSLCRLPLELAGLTQNTERLAVPERPQFYDFDLYETISQTADGETPLGDVTFVVFDSETTGLEPSRGDKMVQLAGVRVVNGTLLEGEYFDELINPERAIPLASSRIHGITGEMVVKADTSDKVVRRFYDFAKGSVLVAHNAPFDMAFLHQSAQAGDIRFDHMVLDTVLLAAHVHGPNENLTLDRLCEIYGVTLPEEERHTALGDSIATARVLLALIDQLKGVGVTTLEQALIACEAQVALRKKQKKYQ